MIPKIIHYCWLSGDPFPPLIEQCMKTWKEKLPDYQWVLWDTKKFPVASHPWVKEAFEQKKYAFAADYIRLYAVHEMGGIYLDTDIEVKKSFDNLLHLPYFLGYEDGNMIEAGVFGAQKDATWLKECMSYYENRSFVKSDGNLDILTLPRIITGTLEKRGGVVPLKKLDSIPLSFPNDGNMYVFPKDYFCAKNHGTGIIEETENTYSIHHFAMSWVSRDKVALTGLKKRFMKIFGPKTTQNVIRHLHLRRIKERYLKFKENHAV